MRDVCLLALALLGVFAVFGCADDGKSDSSDEVVSTPPMKPRSTSEYYSSDEEHQASAEPHVPPQHPDLAPVDSPSYPAPMGNSVKPRQLFGHDGGMRSVLDGGAADGGIPEPGGERDASLDETDSGASTAADSGA